MKHVVKAAKRFKREIGKITVDTLTLYLAKRGWVVMWYTLGVPNKMIEHLHLTDYAMEELAFKYEIQAQKLVFVREDLEESTKIYCILHEIGHILLEHKSESIDFMAEREANLFAELSLAPGHRGWNRAVVICCAAAIVIACGCAAVFTLTKPQERIVEPTPSVVITSGSETPTPAPDSVPTSEPEDLSETVIFTTGGEKYHKPNCVYVRNKTNVIKGTVEDALVLGKEPCSVCFGYLDE